MFSALPSNSDIVRSSCASRLCQRATSIALLDLNEPTWCTGPNDLQGFRAADQTGRSRICSISNAPWLFSNENMGLNLPFAVRLVFIKLNGTSGQYGRFLAFYQ